MYVEILGTIVLGLRFMITSAALYMFNQWLALSSGIEPMFFFFTLDCLN